MPKTSPLLAAAALVALVVLSGCESATERAERYFRSGMTLLEAGDVDRALVEFRNVFRLNGNHKEARLTYARLLRDRGDEVESYGQYLRLIEQYPQTHAARLALAEMAIEHDDWPEAERHGRAAQKLAPDDPSTRAIAAALDYRAAVRAANRIEAAKAAATSRLLLAADPSNLIARRLLIDFLATGPDPMAAIPEIDAAIAVAPTQFQFNLVKLQLLAKHGKSAAVGMQLRAMAGQFPENEMVNGLLLAWYMDQGDLDGAEAFLRRLAETAGAAPEPRLTIVEFLQKNVGKTAAASELDRLILTRDANLGLYRATRAAISFDSGDQAAAIGEMQAVLRDAEPSAQTDDLTVTLAQMLLQTADKAAAAVAVDQVLARNPGHVEALKLRAAWQIETDLPGEAIRTLRSALDKAPQDAEVLTLMGVAHDRGGDHELAGERYALAVEMSGRGVVESLRYAGFLLADQRPDAADSVLMDALRVDPGNVRLMAALADTRLSHSNWARAAEVLDRLRAIPTPEASAAANRVEAALLIRQEKTRETITFLQGLVDSGADSTAALAAIVQIQINAGQITAAGDYLETRLARTPMDAELRFLRAGVHVLSNEPKEAEAIYQALIGELPTDDRPILALYSLYVGLNRQTDAAALLETALGTHPDLVSLQLIAANRREADGEIDEAIAIYDTLYASDSSNALVANNLASLLASHRDDPESLARAKAIAARLRGLDVPAFQDTNGWIEYRLGNYDVALANLEPAARGLPDDALVHIHLGMTYAKIGRNSEARVALTRAVAIAGESTLPQLQIARDLLEILPASD